MTGAWRRDPLRDAYVVVAVLWCAGIAIGIVTGTASDAVAWYIARLPDPYQFRDYDTGYGFFFTPPIAFLIYPLTLLPWPLFAATWAGIAFAALYYLAGRLAIVALLLPPVFAEVHQGNVNLLIAAASLLMLRWPAVGSFLLLTKITPGIALVWFAVRREWRSLAIAGLTTAAVAGVTAVVAPHLWLDWFDSLRANLGLEGSPDFAIRIPLVLRLAGAVALVAWGGLTGRRWTLPVAVVVAAPTLWFNVLAGLVGAIRGRELDLMLDPRRRPAAGAPPANPGARQAPAG